MEEGAHRCNLMPGLNAKRWDKCKYNMLHAVTSLFV
jgi:hypothetical protein